MAGHLGDVGVVNLHLALVVKDILDVEQFLGGQVLAQLVLRCGAGVHEGLGPLTARREHCCSCRC